MIIKKIKEILTPGTNWQDKYEETRKEAQHWEFKFNKLQRQLKAIVKESDV